MRVLRGHKSLNLLRVEFTGVAAHSSLTSSGVNAIEYAAELTTFIRSIAETWRAEGPVDDAYSIPYPTAGVNVVSGGVAANTVPQSCVISFEFRGTSAIDADDIIDRVRAKAAELTTRMQEENPAADVSVEVLATVPGLETPVDSPAVSLGADLGGELSKEKANYVTEAGLFARAGIEAVVCGPGDIAQAHAPNEYVTLDQIRHCERFIGSLISSLSATEPDS